MRARFRQLCDALNDTLTPALRAAGYEAPSEPFSRSTVRQEFRRTAAGGHHTIAVLFRRRRPALFGVQLFVEPPQGIQALVAEGGTLRMGTVSPRRTVWPMPVAPFSLEPSLFARLLRRPPPGAHQVVQEALDLLPEIESWWDDPRDTRHIVSSTIRYPGRSSRSR